YALGRAVVGLLESLMTAKLVDDITDTRSSKVRESWGQGVANIVSGLFGGIGGCAMIGQTMINVKASAARTRISTLLAGVFTLILSVSLGDVVALVPMAALVAVMIFVSLATFDWHSIRPSTLAFMPKSETLVMLVTVVATVATHNLAVGVGLGVLTAMVMFARRVAHLATVSRTVDGEGEDAVARYRVRGELFFASSNDLYTQFDYAEDPGRVEIDFREAHLWDASTIASLDAIEEKYRRNGTTVEITGLNVASRAMRARMAGRLGGGH
uniref:SulP family inorganic anion transporter n=1 Tax=Micrococcus lylae TaxID=1273 RepID=UPI000A4ACC33